MRFRDRTADRQTQTQAVRPGCEKRFEDPLGPGRKNSGAEIPDFDEDSFGTSAGLDENCPVPPGGGSHGLNAVHHYIYERLL